jgi:hypothetical protein
MELIWSVLVFLCRTVVDMNHDISFSEYSQADWTDVVGGFLTTDRSVELLAELTGSHNRAIDYSNPLRYECSLWKLSKYLNEMNVYGSVISL